MCFYQKIYIQSCETCIYVDDINHIEALEDFQEAIIFKQEFEIKTLEKSSFVLVYKVNN